MRRILIRVLFRLLKIPIAYKPVDPGKINDWIGQQYPVPSFRDYISVQNLHLLQMLGEGTGRDEEYWMNVGRRIELGRLLSEAKSNFEKLETARKIKLAEAQKKEEAQRKANENTQNQKT